MPERGGNVMSARDSVEDSVRLEIYGPFNQDAPVGNPLDTRTGTVRFATKQDAAGQWHDLETSAEIIKNVSPSKRYGVGVLHPAAMATNADSDAEAAANGPVESDQPMASDGLTDILRGMGAGTPEFADDDDFDLGETQAKKPSAMGVTGLIEFANGQLSVCLEGARYEKIKVTFDDGTREQDWYLRRPFRMVSRPVNSVDVGRGRTRRTLDFEHEGRPPGVLGELHFRPTHSGQGMYCTAVIANSRTSGQGQSAIFQASVSVTLDGGSSFLPMDRAGGFADDREEEELALLYRDSQSYAVGHGCAADWKVEAGHCFSIRSEVLPVVQTTPLTADLKDEQGNNLSVGMAELASADNEEREQLLRPMLDAYEIWFASQTRAMDSLNGVEREAALRLLDRAGTARQRMDDGMRLLADPLIAEAFSLMNIAMATQQINSNRPLNRVQGTKRKPYFGEASRPTRIPAWRPFQLGFVLQSLSGLMDPFHPDREIADLIFFPTGGGKTEAYLAAAALAIIHRRLGGEGHTASVTVLMRYTLRLLSTQQFQRAASLVCALEEMRRRAPDRLGTTPISLGLWVGSAATPNRRADALTRLNRLVASPLREANPFIIDQCPWCGAQMGVDRILKLVVGYKSAAGQVYFQCENQAGKCPFSDATSRLPIYLVDDDIYETKPTFLIATVDKFAMITREPRARSIFNIGSDGLTEGPPPCLIIQDELHLITGPLGSMVGLYEPVIQELCSRLVNNVLVTPKIIAATATIRRAREQILDLYGKSEVHLFPPHGLSIDSNFFARPMVEADGNPVAGKKYLGVFAPTFGSMQTTQVRVASALLEASAVSDSGHAFYESSDPYWTSVWFFNSLRELGNSLSLAVSDIPDYITGMSRNDRIEAPRWPRTVVELTGRRAGESIPELLRQLREERSEKGAIDMCLASSIMEVGVDVTRLSLLAIVGQPKTTAQYIQVSGRVGRAGPIAPGLVVTLYSNMRSRDRSHYERFTSYHRRLYAQVEPGSVTSFSAPSLRRALHGAMIAFIRMRGQIDALPDIYPAELFDEASAVLRKRMLIVDPDSSADFDRFVEEFRQVWMHTLPGTWQYDMKVERHYGLPLSDTERSLMRSRPDEIALAGLKDTSRQTPTSMRNVDAETTLVTGGNPYFHEQVGGV
jgi:hypothetical protein